MASMYYIGLFYVICCIAACSSLPEDTDAQNFSVPDATFLRYDQNKTPPVWPLQWNATLLIVNLDENPQAHQWKKYYYDWPRQSMRVDFYNHYFNSEFQWEVNKSILFTKNNRYVVYPLEKRCEIASRNFPPVNPKWLLGSKYTGTYMFRGMECDLFMFNHSNNLQYWQRSSDLTPVRQTNQPTDPGVTDYFDVVHGPQDPTRFVLPNYCPN